MADCPICCEALSTARIVTECGHTFHIGCLTRWYSTNFAQTCPMCRKEPNEQDRVHTRPPPMLTNQMINQFVNQVGQITILDNMNIIAHDLSNIIPR